MGTKAQELEMIARNQGCLGKAADDEPVFVFRAKDELAPDTIEFWAARLEDRTRGILSGTMNVDASRAKIKEARAVAHNMRAWQALHGSKRPD